MIIGDPWLQKHKAILDYDRHVITLRKGNKKTWISCGIDSKFFDAAESVKDSKYVTAAEVKTLCEAIRTCLLLSCD